MDSVSQQTTAIALAVLSLLMALGCERPPQPPQDEELKAPTVITTHLVGGRFKTDVGEAHVGWLVTNVAGDMAPPSQYCLDDGSLYKGAPYRLGRINVFMASAVPSATLNGPAIIYGRRLTGLDGKITRIAPCGPDEDTSAMQMRSDWVADEADWRGHTTRARLAKTDYIEATAVYPLPLVTQGRSSSELTVTNPFDRPLTPSATFSLYYEGGTGKPIPKFEAQALSNLAPGASKTIVVADLRKSDDGPWSFRGYQLEGSVGDVRLDLLVSLPSAE